MAGIFDPAVFDPAVFDEGAAGVAADLAGTAVSTSAGSAALTTSITLVGTAASASATGAALTTVIQLAGTGASTSTGAASLTAIIRLEGTAAAVSAAIADLSAIGAAAALVGTASSASAASAGLTTSIWLVATAAATSGASGALLTVIRLVATATSTSTGAASLTTVIRLVGTAASTSAATAGLTAAGAAPTPWGMGTGVEYCIEVFAGGASFGPGVRIAELWGARNLGWSAYDRRAGKGFATLSQLDPILPLLDPLISHVKFWRIARSGNVNVFSGGFIDFDSTGDDVVLEFYDYLALLSVSRGGFKTMYQTKAIGSEIVSPEWTLAKGATYSPLGFVTSGTIEDPVGTDGTTVIKSSAQFGLMDQPRLQLLFDLSEMGRANTVNQVTYGISRTSPHTFSFLRNAGTARDFGLVLNGNVSEYRHLPNWKSYRNDLATVGMDASGGPAEIPKTDETAAAAKGRRQDVFTIKTLLGIAGAATEADQQQAVAARMLKTATQQQGTLLFELMPGFIEPFTGWDINDTVPVEIGNGIDSITGSRRIVGAQSYFTETGESLSLITEPIAA